MPRVYVIFIHTHAIKFFVYLTLSILEKIDVHWDGRSASYISISFTIVRPVQSPRATQGTGLLNEVFARIKAIQFLLGLETLCVSERPRHRDKVARFGRTKGPIRRKGCSWRLSWQLLIFLGFEKIHVQMLRFIY